MIVRNNITKLTVRTLLSRATTASNISINVSISLYFVGDCHLLNKIIAAFLISEI